jgi:antitoxin CptB
MSNTHLRWGCRRGMLELDLMLLPFFDRQFESLPEIEQQAFELLLSEQDQDIYAWILNFQACLNPSLFEVLAKIRKHHDIHSC